MLETHTQSSFTNEHLEDADKLWVKGDFAGAYDAYAGVVIRRHEGEQLPPEPFSRMGLLLAAYRDPRAPEYFAEVFKIADGDDQEARDLIKSDALIFNGRSGLDDKKLAVIVERGRRLAAERERPDSAGQIGAAA